MIPIKLTIEGMYSYQEVQTIDFTTLTRAGLFGIFGTTGSGKSTILEAISFALYGDTERMNSKDRAYNMMNLKSNRLYIEFEFRNFEGKTFKSVREFRRNSKAYDDVKARPKQVLFYRAEGDKWIPLEDKDATKIVGMSYENFRRTIIIPQGRFQEFLELGPKDRNQMLKEIFNLHRFDLFDKTATLFNDVCVIVNQLEGELKAYEEFTKELESTTQDSFLKQKELVAKIQSDFQVLETKYQQLKSVRNDFQILIQKREKLALLSQQESDMDALDDKIQEYERLLLNFKVPLENRSRLIAELKETEMQLSGNEKQLGSVKNELKQTGQELDKLRPRFERLAQKRQEEAELLVVADIQELKEQQQILEERTAKGEIKVAEKRKELDAYQIQSAELQEKIRERESGKMDWNLLLQMENWYNQQEQIQNEQQKQRRKLLDLQNELSVLETELKYKGVTFENYATVFEAEEAELKKEFETLNNRQTQLEVQQQLAGYSEDLTEGVPCPLCGSEHHPQVVHLADVSDDLIRIQESLKANEIARKSFQKKQKEVEHILVRQKLVAENGILEEREMKNIEQKIKGHQSQFVWKEFSPTDKPGFLKVKEQTRQLEQDITVMRVDFEKLQKVRDAGQTEWNQYQELLHNLMKQVAQVATAIEVKTKAIRYLNWASYQDTGVEVLKKTALALKNENDHCEKRYAELNEKVNSQEKRLAGLAADKKNLSDRKMGIESDLKLINDRLSSLIVQYGLISLEDVQRILAQNMELDVAKKRVQSFRIEFNTLKNGIRELEQKPSLMGFDEKVFLETENQWNAGREQLKELNQEVARMEGTLERIRESLKVKAKLTNQKVAAQKRLDNLITLKNLFKGAGFVEYVASTYLSQLCDEANIRFSRMTRGQLSLALDTDGNGIEIIDYLNGGKKRSVSTLSGGQAFQASLSLALALAASVQSTVKAEKSFFFIDEGFGTQDEESVNIVFDTLIDLNKENKIVGIISHVEELQERIPVSLSITRDSVKGSLVSVN